MLLVIGSLARRDTYDGIALEVVGAIGMLVGVALAVGLGGMDGRHLDRRGAVVVRSRGCAATVGRSTPWPARPPRWRPRGPGSSRPTCQWWRRTRCRPRRSHWSPDASPIETARRGRGSTTGRRCCSSSLPHWCWRSRATTTHARSSVGLGALAVLLVGARRGLQAPIVLGALTLVVLGVDKLGPAAVRLPRWVMLAFAGSLLLWVGSTFERRRDGAQRAARRFERLG